MEPRLRIVALLATGGLLLLVLELVRQRRLLERGGGRSSIRSGKSVYYMIKVLLAIFVGLAREKPVVDPGDEAPVAATQGI